MYQDITLEINAGVALIGLNRPEVLNAIRIATYQELIHALGTADNNPDVSCILIFGHGHSFCAGNDLRDLLPGTDIRALRAGVAGIFDRLARLQKPLILAQEGVAVGIGANLMLHADMVIASTSARYSLPFARIGVCSEGACSVLLPAAIGPHRSNELLMTGRNFSVEEACQWGLVNQICTKGEALKTAHEVARQLLANSGLSIAAIRQLGRPDNYVEMINQVVEKEMDQFEALLALEDTRSRIRALLIRP
ncbi:enoyl-CoA hydratase/isomerase family protein [Parathalassolituus penaei]|uniref:Enoyl-CoA hydratase/isomerase family protein n=1 Tax=Parathalassolituus penaei TaxID=2997323 RepID=A0A9X3EAR2_9GAMM|nr:enoyl-CoA hydratase/isomerase family protein [Parathalassolituus penaei]MCY0964112.1 enoyl-CoA hydratase/isomerase family protein [Parathalassolituus penaei]